MSLKPATIYAIVALIATTAILDGSPLAPAPWNVTSLLTASQERQLSKLEGNTYPEIRAITKKQWPPSNANNAKITIIAQTFRRDVLAILSTRQRGSLMHDKKYQPKTPTPSIPDDDSPAPKPPNKTADIYTTRKGDTWPLICYMVYGTKSPEMDIREANSPLTNTQVFGAGIEIMCPDEVRNSISLPPWKDDE